MPKGVAKSGKRKCSPRVVRVILPCHICGVEMRLLPGFLAQHPTTRFCGRRCAGLATRKAESQTTLFCGYCGVEFKKRTDHVGPHNYCSKPCSDAGRRVEGAKWRDREQIRKYMKAYQQTNKTHLIAQAKAWAQRNREKSREIKRKWARANPKWAANNARLRRAGGTATVQDWLDILEAHGGLCAKCGTSERIECDHIVPITKGGLHEKSNLQPLCRVCNARKGAKLAA